MNAKWDKLANNLWQLQRAVKDDLDKENASFHEALNSDGSVQIEGIHPDPKLRNKYLIEKSDILFWSDPTAYLDELERWEGLVSVERNAEIKEYLLDTDQKNSFSNLVSAIRRNRVAPFIGAGFSKSSGYPLWAEAIEKLIRRLEGVSTSEERARLPALAYLHDVRILVKNRDFFGAVELLYEKGQDQLVRFIRNEFDGADTCELKGPLKLLPSLSDGCIVTTNFDGLIEKMYSRSNRPIEGYMHGIQSQNQFASRLIQGDRCILKLHGHFNSSESLIFSKSQYDDAYGNSGIDYTKPLAKVLRQIFVSHSLLFLGCSLELDRTLELFKNVVDSREFDIPDHFALLPNISDHSKKLTKESLLSAARIRPIWYSVSGEGEDAHAQLETLLRFAIDCSSGTATV
jgi:hypothetical protein